MAPNTGNDAAKQLVVHRVEWLLELCWTLFDDRLAHDSVVLELITSPVDLFPVSSRVQ